MTNDVTRNSVEIALTNEQKADFKWLWRHMVATNILSTRKKQGKGNSSLSYRFAGIICEEKYLYQNRLTSGELLSNNRWAVGFVSS